MKATSWARLLGVLVAAAFVCHPAAAAAARLLVFAAASLKNALDDIALDYRNQGKGEVVVSYGASSALARQIEAGAPADIFISADLDWMDYLAGKHLIKPATRSNLLSSAIVLIAPAGSTLSIAIAPNFPLAESLGNGRLAMADPASVPAGENGKAPLRTPGGGGSCETRVFPGAPKPPKRAPPWEVCSICRGRSGAPPASACGPPSGRRSGACRPASLSP